MEYRSLAIVILIIAEKTVHLPVMGRVRY